MNAPDRTPASTYRLQISPDFTFLDAVEVVPYLAELGVGALYLSPMLRSSKGSVHGYDVVDHAVIDPDRGGEAGLAALAEAAASAGLSLVVDTVPNHMGVVVPAENAQWWDVLRLGRSSAYAEWFDIDWEVADGKVLLPVLGDDADLDKELVVDDGELRYFEHRFPLAPGTDGGTPAEIHARQNYELINYRRADTEQNYRRFFAVTGLAAVRVEDERVYEATQRSLFRVMAEHGVVGIRIDHPDGLADPAQYLQRLAASVPDTWILVEKITQPGETLPPDWPVAGLTGYDALNQITALLLDPAAEPAITAGYQRLTGDAQTFEQHAETAKRTAATTILQAEVSRIARLAPEITDARPVLAELAVAFSVYRSYLPQGREHLDQAAAAVRQSRPDLVETLDLVLARIGDPSDEMCVRFQQLSGAVMAKGVEDAAFYRYTRFLALNEVGGEPGRFGATPQTFHTWQRERLDAMPTSMTTLSTHDTKRGEDIRARLAVLAELPDEWHELAAFAMQRAPVADGTVAYLLWQTAVAVAVDTLSTEPGDYDETLRERLHAYLEKAMREAGVSTDWLDPDAEFESTVHRAVDAIFDDTELREAIATFAARIEPAAWSNSLSQKVIQLTVPGVPDVYQGSEGWEDSLVDPDNRRPVDFTRRAEALGALAGPPSDHLLAKLWVTSRTLRARRDHPEFFRSYTPITPTGPAADHAVVFDRGGAITVATRLPVTLAETGWQGATITLPEGEFTDVFTERTYRGACELGDVLGTYPVALLVRA